MPLYSDSNYYYSGGSSQLFSPYYTGSTASPSSSSSSLLYSSSPYSPTSYNRPYTGSYVVPLTSSRSTNYAGHSGVTGGHGLGSVLRYQPKLSTITESSPLISSSVSAATALHSNLMPLTRIQSPKYNPYSTHNPVHTTKYIPPRPILINTADIDVTANRYRKRKQAEFDERQWQKAYESPRTSMKIADTTSSNTEFVKETADNKSEQQPLEEREQSQENRGRSTIRRNRTVVRLSTIRSRNKGPNLINSTIDNRDNPDNRERDKESDTVEKTLQSEDNSALLGIDNEVIPTFHDICEDISSDKIDDDLNAGELRRRASLICSQDQEFLNQLEIFEKRNSLSGLSSMPDVPIKCEESKEPSSSISSESETSKLPTKKKSIIKKSNKNKEKNLLNAEGKGKLVAKKKVPSKQETKPEIFKFDAESIKELNKEYTEEKEVERQEDIETGKEDAKGSKTPTIAPLGKLKENTMKTLTKGSKLSSSLDIPIRTASSPALAGLQVNSPAVATPKSIRKNVVKKSDNDSEDFWAQIGTRETIYLENRKKNILQMYSTHSEDLSGTTKALIEPSDEGDLKKNLMEKNLHKKLYNRANSSTVYSNESKLRNDFGSATSESKKSCEILESPTKISDTKLVVLETHKKSDTNESSSSRVLEEEKNSPTVQNMKAKSKGNMDKINKPAKAQSLPEEATTIFTKITGQRAKSPEQCKEEEKVEEEADKQLSRSSTIEMIKKTTKNAAAVDEAHEDQAVNDASSIEAAVTAVKQPETKKLVTDMEDDLRKPEASSPTTTSVGNTMPSPTPITSPTTMAVSLIKTKAKPQAKNSLSPLKVETKTSPNIINAEQFITKAPNKVGASPTKSVFAVSETKVTESAIAAASAAASTIEKVNRKSIDTADATDNSGKSSVPDKKKIAKTNAVTATMPDALVTSTKTTATTATTATTTMTIETSTIMNTSNICRGATNESSETTCENKSGIHDKSISAIASGNNGRSKLSKFATVSNLAQCLRDVDADLDDYIASSEEYSDYDDDNGDILSDLDISNIDGWDNYSVSMKKKVRHQRKKAKQQAEQQAGFDPQKKVKIDTTRKLYVKEEAPRYPLVATPRPLWKREKIIYNNNNRNNNGDDDDDDDENDSDESDNDSDGSTDVTDTSDECNTSEEYDDDINNHHKNNHNNNHNNNDNNNDNIINKNNNSGIIRMSTSSNDSGFEGGTAPTSPKRMLECDVNCHKKCERLTANLCGVNQKLIVEALASVKRGGRDTRDSPSTPPSLNPAYKIDSNGEPPQHYTADNYNNNYNNNNNNNNNNDNKDDDDAETSYTYAQFQKSGRFTSPATIIPRFKNYSVDDFHFLAVLGKGSFGKVLLAELRDTTYYYAIKCLKKDVVLEDDDVDSTLIERKVLALGTSHPYLCHLFCTFQTESHLFFVMEYLNGGDLMFHIQESGRFPEERARFYGAEIISGLKFLHKKGIIYRDLKLDNVLLDYEGHVRIADFGMCKLQIYLDKTADSFCGTPDYMAPEIIKGENYNQNVDWWSFGVLLYEMLIGQSPFSGCDEDELFWSICNEIPWFPVYITTEATSILKGLLEKDHNKRIGSHYSLGGDICHHVFFRPIDWQLLEKRLIPPPFRPQVKHPLDTQYFDRVFTRERVRLTPIDKDILQSMDQKQFLGFTYTNPHITLD